MFSASYSGLFKMFFDVLQPESLAGKPALIAATGGTARHSLMLEHAMRPLFTYLRTIVVPTAVFAATEDFGQASGAGRSLAERIDRAADELASLIGPATPRTIPAKAIRDRRHPVRRAPGPWPRLASRASGFPRIRENRRTQEVAGYSARKWVRA